ncbi:MAG: hypothetical protein K9G76_10205 [Bacteroidales bacterium]|nr:hypothetical protein [Bacteroidales bacterium]MCF8404073.1 hypothetical protein [Bacteroidales bacterium]
MTIKVILLSVLLLGLAVMGIAIKMFLQKGGQFTKSCSSVDTSTGKRIGCTCDNQGDEKSCVNYEKHHGVLKD